jgi:hypothetical protein
MSTSTKKWLRECVSYAKEQGLERPHIVQGGVHPKLMGSMEGRAIAVVIPRVGTTFRHRAHFRTQIRRVLRGEEPR